MSTVAWSTKPEKYQYVYPYLIGCSTPKLMVQVGRYLPYLDTSLVVPVGYVWIGQLKRGSPFCHIVRGSLLPSPLATALDATASRSVRRDIFKSSPHIRRES